MSVVPHLNVKDCSFSVLPMETRFPFRYGIASMTELPHLMLRLTVEIDGQQATGVTAEGLPPKWFTKNPDTTFEEDLPDLYRVIGHAAACLLNQPAQPFIAHWQQLWKSQEAWLHATFPNAGMLLGGLGVSLMERGMLDALCRHLSRSVRNVLRDGVLGETFDLPPPEPHPYVRHTVGLGDPLKAGDSAEPVEDGLPLFLDDIIAQTGCRYFKIKVGGNLEGDLERLRRLAGLLPSEAKFTIDGNEQYHDLNQFAKHWESWKRDASLAPWLERGLLFIEQPLHRDRALNAAIPKDAGLPPLLIDEADADLTSLPRALELGYCGCSHKNCKGLIKGLHNAALLREQAGFLSGEDLANVGPVALLQDLALMSLLGISHIERNGHHYFRGLSMWPDDVQETMLAKHADLYTRHPDGFATLRIEAGRIRLDSVQSAPFGCAPLLDTSQFEPLELPVS